MPWFYIIIVSTLLAFLMYVYEQLNKLVADVKYIKMKIEKM